MSQHPSRAGTDVRTRSILNPNPLQNVDNKEQLKPNFASAILLVVYVRILS